MTKEEVVPMPSFAAKTGRGFSKKNTQAPTMISVELRTPNGTITFSARYPFSDSGDTRSLWR